MIDQLYQYSFLLSLIGLIGWFFVKHASKLSSVMRMVFFLSMSAYLYSVVTADATMTYKLSILFRDLIIISSLASGFSLLRKNPKAFILLLLGTAVVYQMYFKEQLAQTFIKPPPLSEKNISPDGELLLEIKEGHNKSELTAFIEKYHLVLKPAFMMNDGAATDLDDYWLVDIPANLEQKYLEIIKALQSKNSVVDHVEINELIKVSPIVSEAFRKRPIGYGLNDPEIGRLWGFDEMDVADFYGLIRTKKIKPKRKAHIFILDTGVDGKHEDIAANYKSIKPRYDKDVVGHGTHCAGIAAAVSNNSLGIASLAMDQNFVKVSSIKVLNNFGGGTQQMIINGMLEAADNGADVISMSLGGRSTDNSQRAYQQAVEYANKKGAIVVVAAGNNNGDAKEIAPANAKGVITVSAVDTMLNKASFSNYIQNVSRGIAAPGVNIYSCIPGNKYTAFNGTSMATPYVAGLLGIMKSIDPDLTTEEAYQILKKSGKETLDVSRTGKLIQPGKALGLLLKK